MISFVFAKSLQFNTIITINHIRYSINRNMSKIDKIKEKYVIDTQQMASKPRFGYFSILPSKATAITQCQAPKPNRNSDGKVVTEPRNIYSGITSTGSLKKNFFSYIPSAITGSNFQDPGKFERLQALSQSKKWEGKDVYKPAKLSNTIISAAYEYISPTDPKQKVNNHRNKQGKVITENSNVLTSPTSKLQFQKLKQFKYVQCPPNKIIQKVHPSNQDDKKQPNKLQEPFKTGSPKSKLFYSYSQTYFDSDIKRKEQKKLELAKTAHQAPFKPSCFSPGKDFTRLVYVEEGKGKEVVKLQKKENKAHEVAFKLIKIESNSKPSPSIAYSKINVLRGIR